MDEFENIKGLESNKNDFNARGICESLSVKNYDHLPPEVAARVVKAERIMRSTMFRVVGYDTSLTKADIKSALTEHFSLCGSVEKVSVCMDSSYAIMFVLGEGAREKVLQLDGCDMGGCKLAVTPSYNPSKEVPPNEFRIGYCVYPPYFKAKKGKSWRERKIERTQQLQLEQQQGKRTRKSADATTLSVPLRDLAISPPPPPTKTHRRTRVGIPLRPVTNEVSPIPSWVPPKIPGSGSSSQMSSKAYEKLLKKFR